MSFTHLLLYFGTFIINTTIISEYGVVLAKEYKRCEISKILEKNNFDRTFLPAWLCIINAESGRETTKITTHSNPNRKSYGLFQISSMDYCNPGKIGGLCQKKCEDFLDDDLKDDMQCAKTVQKSSGFKVWPKFDSFCKKQLEPWVEEIKKCLVNTRSSWNEDTYLSDSSRPALMKQILFIPFTVVIFLRFI